MFTIENVPCVNIEAFSASPEESERLLLPGTTLKVVTSLPSELDDDRRDVRAKFIKSRVVFDFMHPQWPIDLFSVRK
jgi:hypothetical protein